jgi:hypothetical protein
MNISLAVLIQTSLIFIFTKDALAYIDPGTGASFLAIVASTIIASIAYIKIQWNNIKNYIKKIKHKIKSHK